MPRYYFNIVDDKKTIRDLEGTELPSVGLARDEAIEAARELLADKVLKGELIDGQEFEIFDSSGNKLLTVPFKDALKLK